MHRRRFLQFAGSYLTAMGLSQLDFFAQAERYRNAITQGTTRKLALLVGVGDYPQYQNLKGSLTDVDLQYELLVHRFGFHPADVVKISDNETLKPNRETILRVFQEHLIGQAKPGDVVVFHFSGHGAQVIDPHPIYENSRLDGSLVPNDPHMSGPVPDIMGRTLFLLTRAIATENVTVILDACHSGGGLRGNGIVRAAGGRPRGDRWPTPEEFELEQDLLKQLTLSFEDFQAQRQAGQRQGLGISSTQFNQLSWERSYGGASGPGSSFRAGAFTYLLTRYLWQMPGTVTANALKASLVRSTQVIGNTFGTPQLPSFQVAPESDRLSQPIYFTPSLRGPAEAVVTASQGSEVSFWLGGVSAQALAVSGQQVRFTALNERREPVAEIEQISRQGLQATGRVLSGQVSPGMLLRETVVGLPHNLQLVVGVDPSFGNEVASAISAVNTAGVSEQTGRSRFLAKALDETTEVDCVLMRMTSDYVALREQRTDALPQVGTIGLFTPILEPISGTHGLVDESSASAATRLRSRLKVLLVNKALQAMSVTVSSLPVAGKIFSAGDEDWAVPISRGAAGGPASEPVLAQPMKPFKAGDALKIQVVNQDKEQGLYVTCLVVDDSGDMNVLYPVAWDAPDVAALIEPNSELVIPRAEDNHTFQVTVDESGSGVLVIVTLVSSGPLRNALRAMQEMARSRGVRRGEYLSLEDESGMDFLAELLGDVDELSRGVGTVSNGAESVVDGGAIAVFSTVIEVVAA